MSQHKILIGKIVNSFGVKGWVKIISYTDPHENIFNYVSWEGTLKNHIGMELAVEKWQTHKNLFIAKIIGIEDRNQSEQVKSMQLWINKSQLPDLESGEYYWHQLINLSVFDIQNKLIGQVERLMSTGSNDVLIVKNDQKEHLIPYIKEQVIKNIDLKNQKMIIDWEL